MKQFLVNLVVALVCVLGLLKAVSSVQVSARNVQAVYMAVQAGK